MIRVFYNDNQTVRDNRSTSPSAGKPEKVVREWHEQGLDIDVDTFKPLTREDFYRAHDRQHIDDLLACHKPNGFGNRLPSVAASLPWTTGSMYAAAEYAMLTNTVAASPTSGFHHAGFDYSGAFCTVNGLAMAALKLRDELGATRVGVIDCDAHYGNGTDDIRQELDLGSFMPHYTFGGRQGGPRDEQDWLYYLAEKVLPAFAGCDVVLYQAGADPHINDPLGGYLSTAAMQHRDLLVFDRLKRMGVPVAWNLAGGYQDPLKKVLDLHTNTMRMCIRVHG